MPGLVMESVNLVGFETFLINFNYNFLIISQTFLQSSNNTFISHYIQNITNTFFVSHTIMCRSTLYIYNLFETTYFDKRNVWLHKLYKCNHRKQKDNVEKIGVGKIYLWTSVNSVCNRQKKSKLLPTAKRNGVTSHSA